MFNIICCALNENILLLHVKMVCEINDGICHKQHLLLVILFLRIFQDLSLPGGCEWKITYLAQGDTM